MGYRKLSKELYERIANEYVSSTSNTSVVLSKRHRISTTLVHNILKIRGVSTNRRQGYYGVDIDYLKDINTANKAYFLGLLHSDGNNTGNNALKISLQEEDVKVLQLIKEDMQYTGPLLYIKRDPPRKNHYCLRITDKEIAKDAEALGYVPNKTYVVGYPNISEQMDSHFIRGLFDGDGCISASEKGKLVLTIVGNKQTLDTIHLKLIYHLQIISSLRPHHTSSGIYVLTINKKENIYRFMSFMYNDAGNLYMDRKYDKYISIFIKQKQHLYWQIYCKDTLNNRVHIFKNLQETKEFFGLSTYTSISYCIHKSKSQIYRNRYYINLLKNMQDEL